MEEQIINATENVVVEAAKKGIFTKDNAVKVLAVAGVVTIGVATVKAFKMAWNKKKIRDAHKAADKKDPIDVEATVVEEEPAA